MIKKKTLTPVLLGGIFFLMLGLSFAAVPLYDMFCRITGFGGTTQVSKEAPNIVLDATSSMLSEHALVHRVLCLSASQWLRR